MPSRTSRNFTFAPARSVIPLPSLSEPLPSQPRCTPFPPAHSQEQQVALPTIPSIPTAPFPPHGTPYKPPPLALFAPSLAIDERISRGHPRCISYTVLAWPESAYPVTDWQEFETTPVTIPEQKSIILRFTLTQLQLEVRPLRGSFVTIMDVVLCLYNARNYMPPAIFFGLAPMSHNFLRVHLGD